MSSATDWANAIRLRDIWDRGHQRAVSDDEPTLLVQRITRNPVLCGGATEHFSQHMPVWHPATPHEDGLRPIDVLYGQYDPTTRSIGWGVRLLYHDYLRKKYRNKSLTLFPISKCSRPEVSKRRPRVALAVGLPGHAVLRGARHGPAPAPSPSRVRPPAGREGRRPERGHRQAGDVPHFPALVRDPPVR